MSAGENFVDLFRASKKQLRRHAWVHRWEPDRLTVFEWQFVRCLEALERIDHLTSVKKNNAAKIRQCWRKIK